MSLAAVSAQLAAAKGNHMLKKLSLAVGVMAIAAPASAQLVEEGRIGVMQHNVCIANCKNANKEDGPNVEGELVFASPDFLSFVFEPRPYIVASTNTAGDTNFGGFGLLWNWDFADGWSLEPGLGYVIHDGEVDPQFAPGDPAFVELSSRKVFFGSEDLFRTSLALNRDLGERTGLQLQYEHLSHGQIIGNGRNQGIDNVGVRLYWRFGE